jgi:hypothetical protein
LGPDREEAAPFGGLNAGGARVGATFQSAATARLRHRRPQHHGHHREVDGQQRCRQGGRAHDEFKQFERYVDGAAASGQYLGPGFGEEQAPGFDEAQRGVGQCTQHDQWQLPVLQLVDGVEQGAREVGGGVEVGVGHQPHDQGMKVVVHQRQHTGGGQHHDQTFEGFDGGDPANGRGGGFHAEKHRTGHGFRAKPEEPPWFVDGRVGVGERAMAGSVHI